jgi:hypothetical protein
MMQWIALVTHRVKSFLHWIADLVHSATCEVRDEVSRSPCVEEFERDCIRVLVRETLHDCGHIGYWIEVLYVPEEGERTPLPIGLIPDGELHTVAQLLTKAAEYLDYRTADSFAFEPVDD